MGSVSSREKVPSVVVRCIRVPADGSPAHMIDLPTVDIFSEGNVDSFLRHVPDVRSFWLTEQGWKFRVVSMASVTSQPLSVLNGEYYSLKSFALDDLPINLHCSSGIWGDAFITKAVPDEYGPQGECIYTDVPEELLESSILSRILRGLAEM